MEFINVSDESEAEAPVTPTAAAAAAAVIDVKSPLQCDPRAYGELEEDLALSPSSSGGSDDERWMVLDECFDESFLSDRGSNNTLPPTTDEALSGTPVATTETKRLPIMEPPPITRTARPKSSTPGQSAPPATTRPSSPVPGPSSERIPTKPRNPAPPPKSPLMQTVRRLASPQPLPLLPQEERHRQQEQVRRSTRRPTFEELAMLASDYDRFTDEHLLMLTERYSLTGPERLQHRHMLRGMRVAQRRIMALIRQQYPLGGNTKARTRFLVWMDQFERRINQKPPTDFE